MRLCNSAGFLPFPDVIIIRQFGIFLVQQILERRILRAVSEELIDLLFTVSRMVRIESVFLCRQLFSEMITFRRLREGRLCFGRLILRLRPEIDHFFLLDRPAEVDDILFRLRFPFRTLVIPVKIHFFRPVASLARVSVQIPAEIINVICLTVLLPFLICLIQTRGPFRTDPLSFDIEFRLRLRPFLPRG